MSSMEAGASMMAAGASHRPVRILFVGPYGPGSNAGALARALIDDGHVVQVLDPRYFQYRAVDSRVLRAMRRVLGPTLVREFNNQFSRDLHALRPELVIVFKGESLLPESIVAAKAIGAHCVNFFPDISFVAHGDEVPRTIGQYDHVFTTKSFGPADLRRLFGLERVTFLAHGFDPDLHRPVADAALLPDTLRSDVSFIGTWSPKKERLLAALITAIPSANLKIWGSHWDRAIDPVRRFAVGHDILGALYPLAIQATRINIAILSEAGRGASSADCTTSRTFHIPASGGFMLHERTDELLGFFREDEEVGCFSGAEELCAKVQYFLANEALRETIRLAGHRRCIAEYSIASRARVIVDHYRRQVGSELAGPPR